MRRTHPTFAFTLALALTLGAVALMAQDDASGVPDIPFYEYDPPSTLVVPATAVTRARFPFIDVHNHQFEMGGGQDLSAVTAAMDELNMAVMVNLSGRGFRRIENPDGTTTFDVNPPEYLAAAVANAETHAPGRFVVFTNLSLAGFDDEDWTARTLRGLEADVAAGARGLKIYKNLGLDAKDAAGRRIPVDHPKLDPVWAKCGELGIPVLIHTGEPAPFWMPLDGANERLQEMKERPGRHRDPAVYPSWEEVMGEQHAVFRKHPETTFINAHLGWLGNDLGRLGALMDELPNMYTEIGAVLAELGRQPRFAREWLTRYQDRVMFGKDSWNPEEYATYFRVLETADEYFPYYRRRHAFWKMYGLDLPDE
ncbi:MAG: amidohydrolase family protein, partial [Acidobacteriota bacterium]|nr:amidohydrolase family protein [Acidobacteriota bacterium]